MPRLLAANLGNQVANADALSRLAEFTAAAPALDEDKIERAVRSTFGFKPFDIIQQLDLLRPIYSKTTNYGHFGKIDDPDITWESTDKAADLKKAATK